MSDLVIGALITATGAIVVALITLWQHRTADREKTEREETEKRLEHGETLFGEYRHLLEELRTELAREQAETARVRTDRDTIRVDRDEWRRRAVAAERKIDDYFRDKEQ